MLANTWNRILVNFCFLLVCAGTFAFLLWGLHDSQAFKSLPWGAKGRLKAVLIIVSVAGISYFLGRRLKIPVVFTGLGMLFFVSLLYGEVSVFIVLAVIVFCAIAWGGLIDFLFDGDRTLEFNLRRNFLIGIGFLGALVGLLAHFKLNYEGVYWALLLCPLFFLRKKLFDSGALLINTRGWFPVCGDKISAISVGLLSIYVLIGFMPELGYDALAYHLVVSHSLADAHIWHFDPTVSVMSLLPMQGDWIFSLGYVLSGETCARLINVCIVGVLAWQAYTLAMLFGAKPQSARLSFLLILLTPITFNEGSSLFVEGIWASFIIEAVIILFGIKDPLVASKNSITSFLQIVVLLSFAMATKVISVYFLVAFAVCGGYYSRAFIRDVSFRTWCLAATIFLIFGLSCYIFAFWKTGNPVFPFFNGIFKSPFYPPVNFDNSLFKSDLNWTFIYAGIFQADKFIEGTVGSAGFHIALIPLATFLMLINRQGKLVAGLLVSVCIVFLVFKSQSYLRYIFPVYIFLTPILLIALVDNSRQFIGGQYLIGTLLVFVFLLNGAFLASASGSYRGNPIQFLFGDTERQQYIYRVQPIRQAVDLVNALNTGRRRVGIVGHDVFGYGFNSEVIYANWYNRSFMDGFASAKNSDELKRLFSDLKMEFLVLDGEGKSNYQPEILNQLTEQIADFGRITVRRFKDEPGDIELIKSPNFENLSDWTFSEGASFIEAEHSVVVTVEKPVVQLIPVRSAKLYLNSIRAKCDKEATTGRVQINWMDANSKFISASVITFECTDSWQIYTQRAISPGEAEYGVVYATSHTNKTLLINKVSFK